MNTTPTLTRDRTRITPATPTADARPASWLRRIFGVTTNAQSYRNIAYLLLGLPIGTISFSLLITGVSIGVSTIVLALLGIPVLIGCWYLVRSIANVERATANAFLGQRLTHVAIDAPDGNSWARMRAMTADRNRWRELGFVLARFPLGIATFAASIALLTTSASIASAPVYARYNDDDSFGEWTMSSRLQDISSHSLWSWLMVPLGALAFVASLHLMNKLAEACAQWNTSWLGSVRSTPTAPDSARVALTSGRVGTAVFLRMHALIFAAVMAVLALIDVAAGGTVWIHWPLITWGAALGLHAALVRGSSHQEQPPRHQILRVHETVFASTTTMLVLVDLAGGGGLWFHWPVAVWGTLLVIHEAAVRRYASLLAD